MPNDIEKPDGEKHIIAGSNHLRWSKLLRWDEIRCEFFANNEDDFKTKWELTQERFGRLIHWSAFAIGSEYFAKGACMMSGVLEPWKSDRWMPPEVGQSLDDWANSMHQEELGWSCGTLGNLVGGKKHFFKGLCLEAADRKQLEAGYRLLTNFRNRDLHTFIPSVREMDFRFVGQVFVPCLNILAGCMPNGGKSRTNQIIVHGRVKG